MRLVVLGMFDHEGHRVERHALCDACYQAVQPGRVPHRIVDPNRETCCRCAVPTCSGIYYAQPKGAYVFCDHRGDGEEEVH